MDEQLANRIRFLREANTERMPHSDRGLLDHLLGTRQLLVDWGARPAVCDAGLFHSVYGTEHYKPKAIPLSMRAGVSQLIGDEAESLAWLFCLMRRDFQPESDPRRRVFSSAPPDGGVAPPHVHSISRFGHNHFREYAAGVSSVAMERAPELPGLPSSVSGCADLWRTKRFRPPRC
jgi:hypothetical protein